MPQNNKPTIVYQIYLPSFFDFNNDALGDLPGVIAKLDYLASLGVTHLWISPFTASPMRDNGYDVSDFYTVDQRYGTMRDFDKLVLEANKRNLKIVMDIVFNHTSSEHAWFKQAISSRDNKFQKYFWFFNETDPQVGALKNVKSVFNEPIMVHVPEIKKYYYATFSKYQPDLNWDNAGVRSELAKIIKFWVDKGVGGFRLDVFNMIVKDAQKMLTQTSPWDHAEHDNVLDYWKEVLASAKDLYVVAECNVPAERAIRYTKPSTGVVSSVFSFNHFDERDFKTHQGFRFDHFIKLYFEKSQVVNNQGGSLALTFNNHDNPRLIDWAALKHKAHTKEIARLLEALLIFNSSVPFIYQGDEYGLQNPAFRSASELRDIASLNELNSKPLSEIMVSSRDNARTPMSWTKAAPYFGFSKASPWLTNEYAKQFADMDLSQSFLELITLRKALHTSLVNSELTLKKLTATYLEYEIGLHAVIVNFSPRHRRINYQDKKVVFSSVGGGGPFLKPFEARILQIREHK